MGLKSTEVTRAEWLSAEERKKLGQEKGLVVIEVRNSVPRNGSVNAESGYAKYLQALGAYNKPDEDWAKK